MKFFFFIAFVSILLCLVGVDGKFTHSKTSELLERDKAPKYTVKMADKVVQDTFIHERGAEVMKKVRGGKLERWACVLPEEVAEQESEPIKEQHDPFDYIAGILGTCFQINPDNGWWTYEVCFNDGKNSQNGQIEVTARQFHREPSGKVIAEISLGRSIREGLESEYAMAFKEVGVDAGVPFGVEESTMSKHDYRKSEPFFRPKYLGEGSICDVLDNQPYRKVQIRFSCSEDRELSVLKEIEEPSTCMYVMHMTSNLLCSHPAVKQLTVSNVHDITCFPVAGGESDLIATDDGGKGYAAQIRERSKGRNASLQDKISANLGEILAKNLDLDPDDIESALQQFQASVGEVGDIDETQLAALQDDFLQHFGGGSDDGYVTDLMFTRAVLLLHKYHEVFSEYEAGSKSKSRSDISENHEKIYEEVIALIEGKLSAQEVLDQILGTDYGRAGLEKLREEEESRDSQAAHGTELWSDMDLKEGRNTMGRVIALLYTDHARKRDSNDPGFDARSELSDIHTTIMKIHANSLDIDSVLDELEDSAADYEDELRDHADNEGKHTDNTPRNVLGRPLQQCSSSNEKPTGFFRDNMCRTADGDYGRHTVCAQVTGDFLKFSASRGNDLTKDSGSFKGLHHGDWWCLCAQRWKEAWENGHATPVYLEATEESAMEAIPLEVLEQFSSDSEPPVSKSSEGHDRSEL